MKTYVWCPLDQITEVHDRIYNYTNVVGDSALELLSDVVDSYKCKDIYWNWLNEDALTNPEITLLLECLEAAFDECKEEYGCIRYIF